MITIGGPSPNVEIMAIATTTWTTRDFVLTALSTLLPATSRPSSLNSIVVTTGPSAVISLVSTATTQTGCPFPSMPPATSRHHGISTQAIGIGFGAALGIFFFILVCRLWKGRIQQVIKNTPDGLETQQRPDNSFTRNMDSHGSIEVGVSDMTPISLGNELPREVSG